MSPTSGENVSEEDALAHLKARKLELEIRDLVWAPWRAGATVVISVTTIFAAVYGLILGVGPAQEALKAQRARMEGDELRLTTAAREMTVLFRKVFSEPSDLAVTCLLSGDHQPLFLMVDDESNFPVLLEPIGNTLLPVTPLKRSEFDVDDMEIVARIGSCDSPKYLISSSHRRYDDKRENRVTVFELQQDDTQTSYTVQSTNEFTLANGMLAYFVRHNLFGAETKPPAVDGRNWEKKGDQHPAYAVEIEGATVAGADFWVGLKLPRDGDRAVMLGYSAHDIAAGRDGIEPSCHVAVDLGGDGISGMTALPGGQLLVLSNPADDSTGRSKLHELTPKGTSFSVRSLHPGEGASSTSFPRPDAKAEGIAYDGTRIWIAYDGNGDIIAYEPRALGLEIDASQGSPSASFCTALSAR